VGCGRRQTQESSALSFGSVSRERYPVPGDAMASIKKHMQTFEKVLLGIRASCDNKLEQLEEEFMEQKEWLKTTIADTKSSK
jgi:hypothetical protein